MSFSPETLAIGLILGTLLGLTGAGGSLVALPLLLSLHLPMQDAIGISLGAVGLSALIGALGRWRSGDIHLPVVLILAATGVPGSWLGQWLGRWVPETLLIWAFCLLVLWSAWRMWRQAQAPVQHTMPLSRSALAVIGLPVGVMSGLLGVGGGFLIVPALLWFSPLGMLAATASSMAVIALVSGAGFLMYLGTNSPPAGMMGGLFLGGACGVLLGNRLARRLGGPLLQRIFALMLLAVSLSVAAQKLLS
ncbi:MAG: sulfite exporter TauE/SafE family protein [Thiopseudomonas sp.]|nr:sulfite exporter TauE/SafE family protein [Thiopseudomonas sp.]